MKMSFKLCGCALLLLFSHAVVSFACTIIIVPPTKFNSAEFIFAGQVVGYSGPVTNKYVVGEAWGLIVRPEEKVYLPSAPAGYFEVYIYELEADCASRGMSKSDLSRHYPVGSKVAVIAVEAKNLEGKTATGDIRLTVPVNSDGAVFRVKGGSPMISAEAAYNYHTYRKGDAPGVSLTLELRKDLLRLGRAGGEGERVAVLERLLYHPYRIDYAKIVEDHINDRAVAESLKRRREEWERSRLTEGKNE